MDIDYTADPNSIIDDTDDFLSLRLKAKEKYSKQDITLPISQKQQQQKRLYNQTFSETLSSISGESSLKESKVTFNESFNESTVSFDESTTEALLQRIKQARENWSKIESEPEYQKCLSNLKISEAKEH
jgi:formate dehydrogenase assembly factor FdhD